ncbi:MAG: ATP-binding protein [Acidobacteriota bacterium]
MARSDCPRCEGTGFLLLDEGDDGTVRAARRCQCGDRQPSTAAALVRCGLPRRYLHCSFEEYEPANAMQRGALMHARSFVEDYPSVDRGILFTGTCGAGKTHLAAAILRQLVEDQGVEGVFVDYQDLLKRIQATYGGGEGRPTEDEVLAPVLKADLLVLDDFGTRHATTWVEETVSHLLGVRYNEERVTILTTNLLELEIAPEQRKQLPGGNVYLSERVSERVLSRLHEMCRVVRVEGPDHRRRGG